MNNQTPEFIRGLYNLRERHRGSVATIGTFDGVHLGHQAILRQLKDVSERLQLPSVVILFEPQPHEYFARERAPARLMRLREKLEALFAAGVNKVLCLQFNEAFRSLTAHQFIAQVLVGGLGIRHLVVGDDFRFGCDRAGNYQLLQEAGAELDFGVTDTCTLTLAGERVSSTRIREHLQAGEFAQAEACLGRPYAISGRVGHGKKLGRELGVPTANVRLQRYRAPLSGVFVISALLADGKCYPGVANVGVKPTIGGDIEPLLEVHLLDFDRDIYSQPVTVMFHQRLRAEQKFASLAALTAQLQDDIRGARAYFAVVSPASIQPHILN
ncbi:bifunctional riboflavin kinase/FAD synthetase [Gilvimarinus polysaccharolyticus]|uniref:bifunctional riboflavin kinase/FAD synthetase n=1 Tax=Gilvimarinus polysaccharolyticus TaxID=863921 RepID=UPI0006735168|nr:bifunctional riboflavin kinase/FAD synthetase [Gilvimarinus polysaccharolyticus]